ncbi:Uncharacterized protein conserved in bacteria [Segatella oris]|uniref:Uncharacterized protein conserved in bacteria n=3 Tax=Segatella oris TaxID=28135 RepID=A0A448L3Z5_9BACT|nr:phage baseplate assembly protein V [Segatella oris]VEH14687.1 Uncharacterized protein conserved in bacteria [Segatella oris]
MSILNHKISVGIDGKKLFSFKSLKLHQSINNHHRFELFLDLEAGGNRYAHNLKDSAKWIGKSFAVYAGENSETTFMGVITGVSLHRKNSDFGHILVSGYSETYRLETDLNFNSWTGCTLADIIKEMTSKAGVSARINPEYTEKLDYVCQYNESDFTFIKRLALQYNEWLYYDGIDLVFGRPVHLPDAVKLEFGTSLSSLDIGVKALAKPAKVFSYHSLNDQTIAAETPNKPTDKDQLGYEAFQASLEMYRNPARQYALPRIHYTSEMTRYVRKKQEAATAESHYVLGQSETATLVTGSVVDLKSSFLERAGSLTSESLGEFFITEITHTVGEDSYYSNTFKAIPAVVDTLPEPEVEMPIAEPQMARVTRNDDKFGHGRVQVQMNWQAEKMSTDWLRVMAPDGGSSDQVKSNRGFVFIPEVGDHVLVGFRHGDPNRPYVMGSLFNGTTGAGGFAENHLKSLTTRSGSTITFDDTAHTILLQTTHANSIFVDEKNGTIAISSAEEVNVNTKNVNINASENMNVNVGKDFNMQVGEEASVNVGKNSSVSIQGNYSKNIEKDSQISVNGNQNTEIHGNLVTDVTKSMEVSTMDNVTLGSRGITVIKAQDHLYIKSNTKVDIAKE